MEIKKMYIIPGKLICIGMMLCCMLAVTRAATPASAFSQRFNVQLSLNGTTLKEVVQSLKKQTDLVFSYDVSLESLRVNNVSVKAENEKIETILNQVFKNTRINYRIEDRIITLYSKAGKDLPEKAVRQQNNRDITGTVRDVSGEPIIGANILVKGTSTGVITDSNGNFSLSAPSNAILQISYIGYISQEIPVRNKTTFEILMKEDLQQLENIVVLGYGTATRKADLSASIGTIENVEAMKNRPVFSADQMLQGQIPGVVVRYNGGDPASGTSISIRGQGSQSSESPLWVVDGVPGAPLNPNDIESIVVLKDAASAAIYGAYSGSAGVIMVTTKKAQAGKPSLTYEGAFGISQAVDMPQSLTIEDQKEVRRTALAAVGASLPPGWDPTVNPYIAQTRTDWIDEITRTAFFQRHHVSLNVNTENFHNRLSLQMTDQQGTLISTHKKAFNLRYDASYQLNRYVRIREDLFWQNERSRGTNTESGYSGAIIAALMMPRNAEARYADGTYGGTAPKDPAYAEQYGSNYADIHGDAINPIRILEAANRYNRPTNVHSSTFLEIVDPIPGLKFTSRFTYRLHEFFNKEFNPKRPEPGKPDGGNDLYYESRRSTRWETENTLNYDNNFGLHNVGALVSTTANEQRGKDFSIRGRNFLSEENIYQYLSFAESFDNPWDSYVDPDNNVSVVGRLSYSWNDRYFATASFRRDYAGRLPEGKKYGDFPAVTAAWKISNEPFMPKADWLNLLKVRASWGRIGNLGSINLAYGNPTLSTFTTSDGGQVGISTPIITLPVYNGVAFNPHLTWETSEQLDIGLDIALLNNRLSISADYFHKKTYDLIKDQDFNWPSYIGVSPLKINQGEIRNSGVEFVVNWNDRIGKDMSYYVSANLGTLKNRVHNIGPIDPETGEKPVWVHDDSFRGTLYPFRTREGGPLYSYWLIKSDGIFQSDEEAAAHVNSEGIRIQPNAKAGDLKFIDQNDDATIDDEDRVYMGAYFPKVTYSIFAGFKYRKLGVDIMLQGVGGAKAFHAWKFLTLNEAQGSFNRWDKILDAWPNTNDIPRLSAQDTNNNFTTTSDWYLENASYLRIKNINISYEFDDLLYKCSSALSERKSKLSLYFSMDNLHTFTSYSGMDPEVGGIGMDGGRYPVPRTFTLGLKLTY